MVEQCSGEEKVRENWKQQVFVVCRSEMFVEEMKCDIEVDFPERKRRQSGCTRGTGRGDGNFALASRVRDRRQFHLNHMNFTTKSV